MASGTEDPGAVARARARIENRPRTIRDVEAAAVSEQAMPAMGTSSDGYSSEELTGLCYIPDCLSNGTQAIMFQETVRWPSGRELMGVIQRISYVCEKHFEDLLMGHTL